MRYLPFDTGPSVDGILKLSSRARFVLAILSNRGRYGLRIPTHGPILRISEKNEEFRPPPQVGIDTNLQFDIFQKKGTPTPTASIDTNGHCG